MGVPAAAFSAFLVIRVLYRHGLLALISALFFLHLLIFFPITSDFSAWHGGDYVLALIVGLALRWSSVSTLRSRQSLFRGALPDD